MQGETAKGAHMGPPGLGQLCAPIRDTISNNYLQHKPMFTSIAAANQLETWEDMHLLAGSFLWVEIVYDKPAETIFRQLIQ